MGGFGFTTVDGSGCSNVSSHTVFYHVPIKIIPMVLPFRLLGGVGEGLGSRLLVVQGVRMFLIHVAIQIITMVLPF